MDFIWETAIRRMVSLSGFRARALQVGTMSDSSVMYWVILLRRRRSISLWFSLKQRKVQSDAWRGYRLGTTSPLCYDASDHDLSLLLLSLILTTVCLTPVFVKLLPMVCFSLKWNARGMYLPLHLTLYKWHYIVWNLYLIPCRAFNIQIDNFHWKCIFDI